MQLANFKQPDNEEKIDHFYGATIITETGEEVPITEDMLQESFDSLIEAWEQAHRKQQG